MATENDTDQPGNAGASGNPSSNGTTTDTAAPPKPPPVYTKDDLTSKIQRELAPKLSRIQELEAKLAEVEAEKEAATLAKLSATERTKIESERKEKALLDKLAAAERSATTERALRHSTAVAHAASRKVASVAASLSHPGLATDFEREVAAHAVVQVDADGRESVAWQHAPGDVVPFEEGFKAHDAAGHFARFMRVATGSGAQHGSGGAGGGARSTNLVDALVNAQKR